MSTSAANRPAPDSVITSRPADKAERTRATAARDYLVLTKPEITFLVVMAALAGFVVGSPDAIDAWTLLWTLLGVALTSGGACALNHYLERDIDASMRRTAGRPLPAGRVKAGAARSFGGILVSAGLGVLCPLVNPLTAVLAFATVALYLFVYTPMKRRSTVNTIVGTLPGALPAIGGYAAATNTVGFDGWIIFAVLLTWQMPHFLSIAWMYKKDYERGGFRMVSVSDPDGRSTSVQMIIFTLLLIGFSTMVVLAPGPGFVYALGMVPLNVWFFSIALRFVKQRTAVQARHVLKASVVYIPVLVTLLLVDRALPF